MPSSGARRGVSKILTWNMLERLQISSGLETPWGPPGGAGKSYWGQAPLKIDVTSPCLGSDEWQKMDAWMKLYLYVCFCLEMSGGFTFLEDWNGFCRLQHKPLKGN